MIHTEKLTFVSEGTFYSKNITDTVQAIVNKTAVQEGAVLVYYQHTTGAVLLIEHEAGMLVDLEDLLEKIVPAHAAYKHHLRGHDANGAAHIRTAMFGVAQTIPILAGQLLLGTYQEIVVVDFDPGEKARHVIVQVTGA